MHSKDWTAQEHLLLFRTYLTEIDWERRAAKVAKECGSNRPKNFFNSLACKREFEQVLSQPLPDHAPSATGVSYSHKAVIEAWIRHFEREILTLDDQEDEMELVVIRKKINLILRIQKGLVEPEELDQLLEEAIREDEKRDPVEVARTVSAYMARLEEVERLGIKLPEFPAEAEIPPTSASLQVPKGVDSAFRSPSPVRCPILSPVRPIQEAIRDAAAIAPLRTGKEEEEEEEGMVVAGPNHEETMDLDEVTNLSHESAEGKNQVSPLKEVKEEAESATETVTSESGCQDSSLEASTSTADEPRKRKGRPPKDKDKSATPSVAPLISATEGTETRTRRASMRMEDAVKDMESLSNTPVPVPSRRPSVRKPAVPTREITPSPSMPAPQPSPMSAREERVRERESRERRRSKAGSEAAGEHEVKSEVATESPAANQESSPIAVSSGRTVAISSPMVRPPSSAGSMSAASEVDEKNGAKSVETQTEVSIRAPVMSVFTSNRKTVVAARRSTRATHSSASKDFTGPRSVECQTGRVEFGQNDEVVVKREPHNSTSRRMKRGLVDVHPVEANDGWGSDDESLITLKRRIRDPTGTVEMETEKKNIQRSHMVHLHWDEDDSVKDESVHKKSEEKKMSKEELTAVKNSLMTYWTQVHAHRYSSIFKHAVTDRDAPGYSHIVKKPMDLWSLKMDIDKGKVLSVDSMKHRLLLMYANAVMFNSTAHDVNTSAKEMALETVEIFRRLDDGRARQLHPVSKRNARMNAEENLTQHPSRRDVKVDSQRIFEMPQLGTARRVRVRLQGEDEFPKLFPDVSFC